MIIDLVVGARPNFVKAAALVEAAKKYPGINLRLIHTNQHKDEMSDPFFDELGLPEPIKISTISKDFPREHRFGFMVSNLTTWFKAHRPDYVMVVGDTDSTAAGAIAAAKLAIPIVHVEAGLRCGDMNMQEEINRVIVDSVSNLMYTTTDVARDQLIAEGHRPSSVVFVGNVMIDTLKRFLTEAQSIELGYPKDYGLLTLHRAENVDDPEKFQKIIDIVDELSLSIPIIFVRHPRQGSFVYGAGEGFGRTQLNLVGPQRYLTFLAMMGQARFVLTDSGGVQEETTALGVPCITLRENTERPETIFWGSNYLATGKADIFTRVEKVMSGEVTNNGLPEKWDGHAAERIMADLVGEN